MTRLLQLRRLGLSSLSVSAIVTSTRAMHIEHIPMRWGRGDNYAYLVSDDATKDAVIIDPAEVPDVLPVLNKRVESGLKLKNIINTHHHYDHAGGNKEMLKSYPVPIIGGKDCAEVSQTPSNQSKFNIGENIEVTAIYTPCHTQDSICYLFHDKKTDDRAVFTGDTLFTAGCGRFFEGTAEEMLKALNNLGSLPSDTKVYPGHEYTRGNLKFAKTVVDNEAIAKLDSYAKKNEYTTGVFTIADEKKFNPFMMTGDSAVQQKTGFTDPVEVMARLREMKNSM